ncbi:hypothetical protein DRJ17_05285 [Candidatus Woesearchaeota archaeon]|nr:MAG: hypothetical protein DRJ17_05285 [Candidatus Woesearchaeota archaeon]
MVKVLDKAKKEYYGRRAKLEMAGWILGFISLAVIIAGILSQIKTVSAIGILLLAIAVYLIIMGRIAHQTLLRK